MAKDLDALRAQAQERIKAASSADELSEIRIMYLGRKGTLNLLIKEIGDIPIEQRPAWGQRLNMLKIALNKAIEEKYEELGRLQGKAEKVLDVTLPGYRHDQGHKHPITQILSQCYEIFLGLGFEIVEGPEVETDYYNFGALNFPEDHPARDMHDSFYLGNNRLLRTHTSPVQVRVMKNRSAPIRIIAPGRVYRRDADISHTPMFHQVEGLLVDKEVSFADLKGILTNFVHQMFGAETRLRFRPSFFPFTEPSAEIDISCVICHGSGCRLCSQSGWLEILGAGMVHPNVFKEVDYDPEQVTGFAFGVGVERMALLKYGIDDIRLFFENDLRFLRQF